MSFPRATGILLHPTSLPARGGIGDFGPTAYEFVDFLAAGKQGLWQVLPLGPLGFGNSPYSSTSAFAGNPLLISLERLADRGWIDRSLLADLPTTVEPVDYVTVFRQKMPLLAEAASSFARNMSGNGRARYEAFCQQNAEWLDDFVLFDALRAHHKLANWNEWPRELAHRDPAALEAVRKEMAAELTMRRVLQFAFAEQWKALRHYCAQKSVRVVGDLAIFVNYDSADVWTHPELFHLDENLKPIVVSGVPPDFFSATGQRWGNPLYRWEVMKERGYSWWVERLRAATKIFDYIRLDHFRGFEQFWEIAAGEPTAIHGRWVRRTIYSSKCGKRLAGCRFLRRTWDTSLPRCMPCGSDWRFRGWLCCSSDSAIPGRISICRSATARTQWCIPAPTTTTQRLAGG
jgi:4-alpha-glucanotransferase